jgi:hypothetical protein
VVTGGRRARWTQIYLTRLRDALGPDLSHRLHMIERVSWEQFPALLKIANVILHPFPFDGSKTSADALEVHKPLVTLPTEYLRGRMGAAFLRTMNLPELVARNRSEYVDIAVRLSSDSTFYDQMVGLITERVDLIWEDMSVPYTWTNLLSTIIGAAPMSWDAFLAQTGRDTAVERARAAAREANERQFDARWGSEHWLLHNGVASLESMVDSADQYPCIFNDWKCVTTTTNASRLPTLPSAAAVQLPETTSEATATAPPVDDDSHVSTQVPAEELAAIRSQYLNHAHEGRFDAALPLALALYPYIASFPLYLTELGLIHVYTGNHSAGYEYCARASALATQASMAAGCTGLAAMYLPTVAPQETIDTLLRAIALKQAEQQQIASTAASLGDGAPTDPYELESSAGVFTSPAFEVTLSSLQYNVLTTLRMHASHGGCVEWFAQLHGLPELELGAAHILTFAAVRWSDGSKPAIDAIEASLRAAGRFVPVIADATLWSEVRRIQDTAMDTLTLSLECVHGLRDNAQHSDTVYAALRDFMAVLGDREKAGQPAYTVPTAATPPAVSMQAPGVVLVLQFYAPREVLRVQEINVALWRNLQNEHITDIYLLNEVELNFAGFPNAHKLHQVVIGERLTFKRAFTFANEHLAGRTIVLGKRPSEYHLQRGCFSLPGLLENCVASFTRSLSLCRMVPVTQRFAHLTVPTVYVHLCSKLGHLLRRDASPTERQPRPAPARHTHRAGAVEVALHCGRGENGDRFAYRQSR